jgi:hypothetical protein
MSCTFYSSPGTNVISSCRGVLEELLKNVTGIRNSESRYDVCISLLLDHVLIHINPVLHPRTLFL